MIISRVKAVAPNLALLMAAFLCSLGLAEGVVRFLYKADTVLFPRYHTEYRYGRYTIRGNRANADFWHTSIDGSWRFLTNSKGFRNTEEFSYEKPQGTLRILSLGDSHTMGYEVRQEFTFSAILERYLNVHEQSAEVINAGVSGFSTAEALVFLEQEGVRYTPDVVVLGFAPNDFEDNWKTGLFGLDGQGRLVEEKFEHTPGVRIQNFIYGIPTVQWLSENSYFYSLLFNGVWNYFKLRLAQRAVHDANKSPNGSRTAEDEFEYAVSTRTVYSEYEIALAAALVQRMQRICEQRGIRLIVVEIPARPAAYRYASSIPGQLVENFKTANIQYMSSQAVLSGLDRVAEMHVPHGHHHISEFTHTLIGVELARLIMSAMVETARR